MEFIKEIDNEEHTTECSSDGEIFKYISLDSTNNKEDMYKKYMAKVSQRIKFYIQTRK